MKYTIEKACALDGAVQVPGDKSIAHRALILGALANSAQKVRGLPRSGDVASTARCLRALGCSLEEEASGAMRVSSGSWRDKTILDAGNSGTTARLLSGLIAGLGLECTIDGDESLRSRPMQRIADPLTRMGAKIRTAPRGGLPMEIKGGKLNAVTYEPAVASAQVKSAVLIAGLFAKGETTVMEKVPTRDHTERMLFAMGVPLRAEPGMITVPGGAALDGIDVVVPGDISSAVFFIVASSILPGSSIRIMNTGINPTRTGALSVLEKMGAKIEVENPRVIAGEPQGDILVRSSRLKGVEIRGSIIPKLIDELPVLAVAATQAEGITTVREAKELRHKESDRIAAMVENLSRLGADVEELEDGFVIQGPCPLKGREVSSFGDHRIAMAMAVAGLLAIGRTEIGNSEAVEISYPGFFHDLQGLIRS